MILLAVHHSTGANIKVDDNIGPGPAPGHPFRPPALMQPQAIIKLGTQVFQLHLVILDTQGVEGGGAVEAAGVVDGVLVPGLPGLAEGVATVVAGFSAVSKHWMAVISVGIHLYFYTIYNENVHCRGGDKAQPRLGSPKRDWNRMLEATVIMYMSV